jgi:hypothetical protein
MTGKQRSLNDLYALLEHVQRELSDVRSELTALRLKGKRQSACTEGEELERLVTRAHGFIHGFYEQHKTPMSLSKLTRSLGRQLARIGLTGGAFVREPAFERLVKALYRSSGATVLLPRAVWDASDETTQQSLLSASETNLHEVEALYRTLGAHLDEPAPNETKPLTGNAPRLKTDDEGTQS